MDAMRRSVAVVGLLVITAAAVTGAGQAPARRPAETTPATSQFGNADVIKLVQSGLSDGFIVARIRQAPATNFDLSSDALVLLKKTGVSEAVLAVMLDPAATPLVPTPVSAPAVVVGQASPEQSAMAAAAAGTREPGIYLGEGAGEVQPA